MAPKPSVRKLFSGKKIMSVDNKPQLNKTSSMFTLINPDFFPSIRFLKAHCFQLRPKDPGSPWRPGGPSLPRAPGSPLLPAGPAGPIGPLGPFGPWGLAFH